MGDLEQAVTGEFDFVLAEFRKALVLHPVKLRRETLHHILAKLLLVVAGVRDAELELEDELADETLLGAGGVGPEDGRLAALHGFHVGQDVRLVLVMHAAKMAK